MDDDMYVIKRDGKKEAISFDKILKRVKMLGEEVGINLNYTSLVIRIIEQLYDGIETKKIDELTAQHCATQITVHPDYGTLASRVVVSNNHKNTLHSFSETMKLLYNYFDNKTNAIKPLLSDVFYNNVVKNAEKVDKI